MTEKVNVPLKNIRIVYSGGGFGSTDMLFVKKFVEKGYEAYLINIRESAYKHPILAHTKPFWINPRQHRHWPKPFRLTAIVAEYIRLVRKSKPDILHVGPIQSSGLMAVLSMKRPLLLMPWGTDWAVFPNKSWFHRLLTKWIVKKADLIQVDCDVAKRKLIEIAGIDPDKIWVFPWGIELETFHPLPGEVRSRKREDLGWENYPILIMTRVLKPIYGIDIFINAVRTVIEKNVQARVLICGDGPLRQKLEELTRALGLNEVIRFMGWLSYEDLNTYLNASDIYISSSYSDGTSLALLNAMAVGLPVIVSDVPANLEWIRDGYNGIVFPRGSIKDLAAAIEKAVKQKEGLKEMGSINREIALKKADWNANFEKFERMYEMLLDRKYNFQGSEF